MSWIFTTNQELLFGYYIHYCDVPSFYFYFTFIYVQVYIFALLKPLLHFYLFFSLTLSLCALLAINMAIPMLLVRLLNNSTHLRLTILVVMQSRLSSYNRFSSIVNVSLDDQLQQMAFVMSHYITQVFQLSLFNCQCNFLFFSNLVQYLL